MITDRYFGSFFPGVPASANLQRWLSGRLACIAFSYHSLSPDRCSPGVRGPSRSGKPYRTERITYRRFQPEIFVGRWLDRGLDSSRVNNELILRLDRRSSSVNAIFEFNHKSQRAAVTRDEEDENVEPSRLEER
jgi:hypothetical protein